ncbi:hypothetical protein EVAR_4702_1 [Eumeta japonica]|uniref:Uncharacterized protein n=1 Tax=Eumeta variegata TaxID=151549 RepID=A0A4C1WQ14_EUMVA|nr:hypothetical protein EVAR_4702_1 [Eumeta japonica]
MRCDVYRNRKNKKKKKHLRDKTERGSFTYGSRPVAQHSYQSKLRAVFISRTNCRGLSAPAASRRRAPARVLAGRRRVACRTGPPAAPAAMGGACCSANGAINKYRFLCNTLFKHVIKTKILDDQV